MSRGVLSVRAAIRRDHYQSRESLGNMLWLSSARVRLPRRLMGITIARVRAFGTDAKGDVRGAEAQKD